MSFRPTGEILVSTEARDLSPRVKISHSVRNDNGPHGCPKLDKVIEPFQANSTSESGMI